MVPEVGHQQYFIATAVQYSYMAVASNYCKILAIIHFVQDCIQLLDKLHSTGGIVKCIVYQFYHFIGLHLALFQIEHIAGCCKALDCAGIRFIEF